MISVLLIVFILQLAIHLINTVGKQTINDLLWLLYTKLPTPQSKDQVESVKLRREVIRLKREMDAASPQDEFAKWAKLRRQHDKAKEQYDAQAKGLQDFKSTFDKVISGLRWLGTQGLNFFCNFWFSKQAMFWLPQGWVPYPAEWLLSFPRAPLGSISINVWGIACASVIAMLSEGIRAAWTLREGKVIEGANRGERLSMGAGGGEKKEL